MADEHLLLRVEGPDGKPSFEPVHAQALGAGRFRLLYSPGLLYGIAADDEFETVDDQGRFRVLRRSGNVVVRLFSDTPIEEFQEALVAEVEHQLGGRLDGKLERALAFTIPVTCGFPAIERVFAQACAPGSGRVWEYGNVYDNDGATLGWWSQSDA